MRKLRIGCQSFASNQITAHWAEIELSKADIACERKPFNTLPDATDALLLGEVDVVVFPMDMLPTGLPDGLVIAGTSKRGEPSDCILLRKANTADNQLFRIKNNGVVGVSTANRKAQLQAYRPDVRCLAVPDDLAACLGLLQDGQVDALVLPNYELAHFAAKLDGFEKINLNVREFVPTSGQAVQAYLCATSDLETRQLVKQHLHQPDVSAVTNVERKVLKLLGGDPGLPLGAYCERDANGNYHVWAALANAPDGAVRRVRLSQSTHLDLAERVVAGLKLSN